MFLWVGQGGHALFLGCGIGIGVVLVWWLCKGRSSKGMGRRTISGASESMVVSEREELLEQEDQGRRDV